MPNIKSAKKRVLTNQKKNIANRSKMSEVKTAIKRFNNAIDTKQIEEAEKLLPATMSIIDSAAADGLIHKNNAANKKARLSRRLSDVKSNKVVVEVRKDNKAIAAEKALAAKVAREAIRAENARKAAERAAALKEKEEAGKKAAKPAKKTTDKKATDDKKTTDAKKAEKPVKPAKGETTPRAEKPVKPAKGETAPKAETPAKAAKKPAAKKTAKPDAETPVDKE